MKKLAVDYAKKILNLGIQEDAVEETEKVFDTVPQLRQEMSDPTFSIINKHIVIDKIFPESIRDILKILCDNGDIGLLDDIIKAYGELKRREERNADATLFYVVPPTEEQLIGIRQFLEKKMGRPVENIRLIEDKDLIGGFIIHAGDREYDWSNRGRLYQLAQKLTDARAEKDSTENIISILKSEIENFDLEVKNKEVGYVKWVGDGIARISGIDHAMYGEIVMFDSGVKAMVQDIKRNEIGCILFGTEETLTQGMRVVRTGKRAGVPVGDGFKGRVVDALGSPIDGLGDIEAAAYRPIEYKAPGITERKKVSEPLETGILAIDSMFPIGRGQRELIIGDRQTGKTSVAVEAILNQKGKDVVCIYVAIGQKASTIAKLVSTLKKNEAMDYTIIVSATASDSASLQYIAPYSGTAMAEYFMYQGKDVLIVYDDLSKHAVAYRALSLLLERSPGREAYPGDVFYLHSRLLERSSRLNEKSGGGSITALPIIETQAGDVSAYIPTNVISITDGQIFLESDLFFSGMRPAVNVGLSVSRVGGAAQTKAMKKASGSIRIDLAQYREMEVFTQFSSDLDEGTKAQLAYGDGLMELLKQPLCHPLSMHDQVITLCAATHKVFVGIPKSKIKAFQMSMLDFFDTEHPEIRDELETMKVLTDETEQMIVDLANEYKSRC